MGNNRLEALITTRSNKFDVVSLFIQGIVSDLAGLGVNCTILDVTSPQSLAASSQDVDKNLKFDFIFSFNGLLLEDLQVNSEPLFENLSCPLFIFLVDHPLHLLQRFIGQDCIVLCVDKTHVGFCELCGIKAHFFPHALAESHYDQVNFISLDEKQGVVAPLSYFDPEHWAKQLQPVWNQIAPALENTSNVWEFMCAIGVVPTKNQPATVGIDQQVLTILRCVDYYFRSKKRISGLQALASFGLAVDVIGENTSEFQRASDQIRLRPAVNVSEIQDSIARAKYLFHSVPGFSAALHERILFGIAKGTAVISDETESIRTVEPEFAIYELGSEIQLSEQDYENCRNHNLLVAKNKHSWKNRFSELLEKYL